MRHGTLVCAGAVSEIRWGPTNSLKLNPVQRGRPLVAYNRCMHTKALQGFILCRQRRKTLAIITRGNKGRYLRSLVFNKRLYLKKTENDNNGQLERIRSTE